MDDLRKRYEEMERKYLELQQSSASAPAEESAESYVVWEGISLPIIQITPSSGQITRKNTAAQTLLGDVELFEEILPLVTLTPLITSFEKKRGAKQTSLHVQLPTTDPCHEVSLRGQ